MASSSTTRLHELYRDTLDALSTPEVDDCIVAAWAQQATALHAAATAGTLDAQDAQNMGAVAHNIDIVASAILRLQKATASVADDLSERLRTVQICQPSEEESTTDDLSHLPLLRRWFYHHLTHPYAAPYTRAAMIAHTATSSVSAIDPTEDDDNEDDDEPSPPPSPTLAPASTSRNRRKPKTAPKQRPLNSKGIDSALTNWRRRSGWTDVSQRFAGGCIELMRIIVERVIVDHPYPLPGARGEDEQEVKELRGEVDKVRRYCRGEDEALGEWLLQLPIPVDLPTAPDFSHILKPDAEVAAIDALAVKLQAEAEERGEIVGRNGKKRVAPPPAQAPTTSTSTATATATAAATAAASSSTAAAAIPSVLQPVFTSAPLSSTPFSTQSVGALAQAEATSKAEQKRLAKEARDYAKLTAKANERREKEEERLEKMRGLFRWAEGFDKYGGYKVAGAVVGEKRAAGGDAEEEGTRTAKAQKDNKGKGRATSSGPGTPDLVTVAGADAHADAMAMAEYMDIPVGLDFGPNFNYDFVFASGSGAFANFDAGGNTIAGPSTQSGGSISVIDHSIAAISTTNPGPTAQPIATPERPFRTGSPERVSPQIKFSAIPPETSQADEFFAYSDFVHDLDDLRAIELAEAGAFTAAAAVAEADTMVPDSVPHTPEQHVWGSMRNVSGSSTLSNMTSMTSLSAVSDGIPSVPFVPSMTPATVPSQAAPRTVSTSTTATDAGDLIEGGSESGDSEEAYGGTASPLAGKGAKRDVDGKNALLGEQAAGQDDDEEEEEEEEGQGDIDMEVEQRTSKKAKGKHAKVPAAEEKKGKGKGKTAKGTKKPWAIGKNASSSMPSVFDAPQPQQSSSHIAPPPGFASHPPPLPSSSIPQQQQPPQPPHHESVPAPPPAYSLAPVPHPYAQHPDYPAYVQTYGEGPVEYIGGAPYWASVVPAGQIFGGAPPPIMLGPDGQPMIPQPQPQPQPQYGPGQARVVPYPHAPGYGPPVGHPEYMHPPPPMPMAMAMPYHPAPHYAPEHAQYGQHAMHAPFGPPGHPGHPAYMTHPSHPHPHLPPHLQHPPSVPRPQLHEPRRPAQQYMSYRPGAYDHLMHPHPPAAAPAAPPASAAPREQMSARDMQEHVQHPGPSTAGNDTTAVAGDATGSGQKAEGKSKGKGKGKNKGKGKGKGKAKVGEDKEDSAESQGKKEGTKVFQAGQGQEWEFAPKL